MIVKPQRVAFLINGLKVGGAEVQLTRLAIELQRRGVVVTIIALRQQTGLDAQLRQRGLEPIIVGSRGLGQITSLARVLDAVSPDVLITFLFRANIAGRLAGRLRGVPVISSIRNQRFGGATRVGQRMADLLERITNPLAAWVVVNSSLAADDLIARNVVSRYRLRVIPNALAESKPDPASQPRSREEARESLGFDASDFVWLQLGRLEPQKNHAESLNAFAVLYASQPSARLLVVGEGSLRASLESKAASLGPAASAVRFLGQRSDVADVLIASDGMLLASLWEGLPNVVMEAMVSGLPVVATPVGGVPELIKHGETGWLADSPMAEDLVTMMDYVMHASDEQRRSVAQAGRAHVLDHFNIYRVTDAWQDLISMALGERGVNK